MYNIKHLLILPTTVLMILIAGCDQPEPLDAETNTSKVIQAERMEDLGLPLDLKSGSYTKPNPPEFPEKLRQLTEQIRNQKKRTSNSIPPALHEKLKKAVGPLSKSSKGIISVEVKGESDKESTRQKLLEEFDVRKEDTSQVSVMQSMSGLSDVYAYVSGPYDYGSYYAETSTSYVFYQLDVYSDLYINSGYQTSIWDTQMNDILSWVSALARWAPSANYNCFSMDSDHYAYDPSYGTFSNITYDIGCS